MENKNLNTEQNMDIPYKGKKLKQHLSNHSTCCCETIIICSIHNKYISEQS